MRRGGEERQTLGSPCRQGVQRQTPPQSTRQVSSTYKSKYFSITLFYFVHTPPQNTRQVSSTYK
jgi:hypothetical protein